MSTNAAKRVNPREEAMQRAVDSARDARDAELAGDADQLAELDDIAAATMLHDPNAVLPGDDDGQTEHTDLSEFENLPGDADPEPKPVDNSGDPKPKLESSVDNVDNIADTRIIQRDGKTYLKVEINGLASEVLVDDVVTKLESDDSPSSPSADVLPDVPDVPVQPEQDLRKGITESFATLVDNGNVEVAVDQLLNVLQDVTQIDSKVDAATAKASDKLNLTSAWDEFSANETYSALTKTSESKGILDSFCDRVIEDKKFMEGKPSYNEIFSEAGDRMLAMAQTINPAPVADPEPDTTLRDKKRQLPNDVPNRTARRSAPEEDKPKNNTDIISDMKRSRHQKF